MSLSKICSEKLAKILLNRLKIEKSLHEFARKVSSNVLSGNKVSLNVEPKADWKCALKDAEKIVGYKTSFLNLRYLLSDEMANLALHMRKLVGSTHPLMNTAKSLLSGQNNMQTWGLVILLVSKMAGHSPEIPVVMHDKTAGVLNSQRTLAEITEMIRTANLIHQGMINLQILHNAGNDLSSDSDMIFGNKLALLGGDYLLGNANVQLSSLKNQEVNELIATAIRDLSESNFIGDRDDQNIPIPWNPSKTKTNEDSNEANNDEIDNKLPFKVDGFMGNPESEWELRHVLSGGSLLGKSCQCALILAKQPQELQRHAYFFGKHLSLAWQASMDLEPFVSSRLPADTKFSLISAPVLFHLEHDNTLYNEIKKGIKSVEDIDFHIIHKEIFKGPALRRTKELQNKHSFIALNELRKFPMSDARTALENIILAKQEK